MSADRPDELSAHKGRGERVEPYPDYVRFLAHDGFVPDFCEAADPESKGIVPAGAGAGRKAAGAASRRPTARGPGLVQGGQRTTTQRDCGLQRLESERDLLRPLRSGEARKVDRTGRVWFGSGRYAVGGELVGTVVEVCAEESSVIIRHHGTEVVRHRAATDSR